MSTSSRVHYTIFPIVGTVNERGVILYVEDVHFKSSTVLTSGTTLANFMTAEAVPKGDAITQGFGTYLYREQLPKEGNKLRFIFLAPKTAAQQVQVVKPAFKINQVTDWPDWLFSLYMLDAVVDLEQQAGTIAANPSSVAVTGQRFLDRYILFRGGNFNTVHEIEEFFSPSPVASFSAEEPRADLVFYNYFGANNQLNCVHPDVTIPEPYISATQVEKFGTENAQKVDWEQGSFFPATNHTGWIPHYRILTVREQDGGFYYRRHKVLPPRISRALQA